jgi:hypothetical protein
VCLGQPVVEPDFSPVLLPGHHHRMQDGSREPMPQPQLKVALRPIREAGASTWTVIEWYRCVMKHRYHDDAISTCYASTNPSNLYAQIRHTKAMIFRFSRSKSMLESGMAAAEDVYLEHNRPTGAPDAMSSRRSPTAHGVVPRWVQIARSTANVARDFNGPERADHSWLDLKPHQSGTWRTSTSSAITSSVDMPG